MSNNTRRRLLPAGSQLGEQLQRGPLGRYFGTWLANPQFWITTRRTTSRAVAIGLFWAWLPVPGVTLVAALHACLFRANIPLSAALVWINNPLTIAPLTLFSYFTGIHLLGIEDPVGASLFASDWQFSSEWLTQTIYRIGKPLFAGALSLALASAAAGYVSTELFWRGRAIWHRRNRSGRQD